MLIIGLQGYISNRVFCALPSPRSARRARSRTSIVSSIRLDHGLRRSQLLFLLPFAPSRLRVNYPHASFYDPQEPPLSALVFREALASLHPPLKRRAISNRPCRDCQLSAVSYQLSALSRQESGVSCQWAAMKTARGHTKRDAPEQESPQRLTNSPWIAFCCILVHPVHRFSFLSVYSVCSVMEPYPCPSVCIRGYFLVAAPLLWELHGESLFYRRPGVFAYGSV